MTLIGDVEDAMIAACKATLGASVRAVESLPSGLTTEELQQRMRVAPAVYIAFLGGTFKAEQSAVLEAQFGAFFLGQTAGDEKMARRGTPTQIGAYTMFEMCVPVLHGLSTAYGHLIARQANNLFSGAIDREGLALYSASFTVPVALPAPSAAVDLTRVFVQYQDPADVPSDTLPVPADQTVAGDLIQLAGS